MRENKYSAYVLVKAAAFNKYASEGDFFAMRFKYQLCNKGLNFSRSHFLSVNKIITVTKWQLVLSQ